MLIQIAILSTIAGVSSAIVQSARPVQYIMKLLRVESFEIMRCRMCFGTWFVLFVMLAFDTQIMYALLCAPYGGFIAEMTDRKLINTV